MVSRLQHKIFGMMILVGVVPLIILGVVALYNLNLFHEIDLSSIEESLIEEKSEEIASFINEIIGTFQLRVGFSQKTDIELVSQHFLLNQLLEEFPSLEDVAFLSLSGKETARFSRSFLKGVPAEELQDQSLINKFRIAKTGKDYVGPIYLTLKGPMITIASPVLNRNNEIISVLAGEVNLSELQKIIEKSRLGKEGYLYLVDSNGFLVAHGREKESAHENLKISTPLVAEVLSGKKIIGSEGKRRYRSFFGEPVVAAGKYLPGLKLGLIAEWPLEDADKVVNTIRNQIIITIFFVLLATVILGIVLTNKIVKPIKTLEAGTKLVAEGKFDQPVVIKTGDEIEELGAAFNDMMKGLKRLQELKDEFVFIAAHELRTPVTAIKGYISMVLGGDFGSVVDTIKKPLDEVKKASERLGNLVNDLLQIARSEAGRLEIKVAAIDIIEPTRGVLSELKPLADEKAIKVIYEPSSLPKALADPARLKEVMVNLVGNAVKYTIGSGTVTISHEVKEKEVITHIKDTGIGMSKEAQAKLFEKFYRVQTEITKTITGTGLGLFIVKQIIEKMNGKIWVESEEGKGSTFSFSLPVAV